MVHQWKAGTERVQQYVKLKQRYQERSEEEQTTTMRNARELLGNHVVGDLCIPTVGVYDPNVIFAPMSEFTDKMEMADSFHFRNTPKNRMVMSDLMEALVDLVLLHLPLMFDEHGKVPKPYEDPDKVKYPSLPVKTSIFHLPKDTEYAQISEDMPFPKWMWETSQETLDMIVQAGWKQVLTNDPFKDLARDEMRKKIIDDVVRRAKQRDSIMEYSNKEDKAERISDPLGGVATATLLLIAAEKDPGIRMWVEEVWLTAPVEERDEDGKPLAYMEKLLKIRKPYYRIGENPISFKHKKW